MDDLIDENYADADIAVNEGVKQIEEFPVAKGVRDEKGAGQEQAPEIEGEQFVLNNARDQSQAKKMDGKIQVNSEEVFLDLQAVQKTAQQ